jgi:predicted outer membrane repeat protein
VLQNIAPIAGGIESYDSVGMTFQSGQITGNQATAGDGGGLFLRVTSSATIQESTFTANTASGAGGGVASDGALTITDSLLEDNQAQDGGGLYSRDALTLERTKVQDNEASRDGGGAGISGSPSLVAASTVSGNTAGAAGGGLHLIGDVELENVTISGNTAGVRGGGVHVMYLTMSMRHATLAGNAAPLGSSLFSTTHFDLRASILVPASGTNCVIESSQGGGGNLDSDGSCGYPDENSLNGLDPLLGPLADNGGPTYTHALLSGSPALDAGLLGTGAVCESPVDQRGVSRPQGAGCDIGAFEAVVGLPLTIQPLPTATPTPLFPPIPPVSPFVVGETDVNCRSGPSTLYPAVSALRQGVEAPADGRSSDSSWLRIRLAGGTKCWVWVGSLTIVGELTMLPVLPAPPLPTGTPTPTSPPPVSTPTDTAIP